MKKYLLLITFIFVFTTSHVLANPADSSSSMQNSSIAKQSAPSSTKSCKNVIGVKVNGLVCDFCARALEKVIGKRDDVAGINVNLDNGSVDITMKQGKSIDDNTLTKLITDSGYNLVSINREC